MTSTANRARKSRSSRTPVRKRDNDSHVPLYQSDAWRHSNVGRLLNNAVRRFEARVFELLAEAGHSEARLPHLTLTRNLDVGGTRITELARRAEITKQAMGELIVQCEERGLVIRAPDPSDARAKIVKFTRQGLSWLEAFKNALQQAEHEMRDELGTLRVDGLSAALRTYAGAYDPLVNGEDSTAAKQS